MMLFDNTMVFSRLSNEDSYLVDGGADDPCQHGGVDGRKDGPLPGAAFVFDSGNGGSIGNSGIFELAVFGSRACKRK